MNRPFKILRPDAQSWSAKRRAKAIANYCARGLRTRPYFATADFVGTMAGILASPSPSPLTFCRRCGYDLHGLPNSRCPECGNSFDLGNPRTYRKNPFSFWRNRWLRRIAVLIVTFTFLAGAGGASLWWFWHRDGAALRMVRGYRGAVQTITVGPPWLHTLLGQRGGFLLERARYLNLINTPVTDDDLVVVERLSYLQDLPMFGTHITDAGLKHLESLTGLQALSLSSTHVTDAGLEHIKGLTGLQDLEMNDTAVTDAGLERVKNLTGLRDLNLCDTPVTDAGLEQLKGLTRLQELGLMRTQVTGAGLEHLKNLTGLRHLDLSDSPVTDAGLAHVTSLTGLQTLDLDSTQITDAGLEHLKGLTGLQTLYLQNTPVTNVGVAKLKQSLPKCSIWH
jgi:hypothetical protein